MKKYALFALQDIVRGGMPGQYIKNKAKRLMAEQAKHFYPAQDVVAGGVSKAFQYMKPEAQAALRASAPVKAGMTPEAAMTVASWSGKKGDTLNTAVSRVTGGNVVKPASTQAQQAPTMALGPRAVGKVAHARFSMLEEFIKLCASEVSEEEAQRALGRLQQLEAWKPTVGQLSRGALVGAGVAPLATVVNRTVSGQLGKGLTEALKTQGGVKQKALGLGRAAFSGGRQLAAASAGTAAAGALLPQLKMQADQAAEKEKLRQYLGTSSRGPARQKLMEYAGV